MSNSDYIKLMYSVDVAGGPDNKGYYSTLHMDTPVSSII